MKNKITKQFIFYAIALAMGVAGVVLSILNSSNNSVMILYGIGIFCLAINGIEKKN
jgi:hypothetical protein